MERSAGTLCPQGVQVPNFIGVDAHGDAVQLYDFAGLGVPIVLDFGTKFCQPCKDIAAFLSTGDMSPLIWNDEGDYYPWWKAEYEDLYRQVQAGELIWITVLFSLDDPALPKRIVNPGTHRIRTRTSLFSRTAQPIFTMDGNWLLSSH